jgi:hypothetical protein
MSPKSIRVVEISLIGDEVEEMAVDAMPVEVEVVVVVEEDEEAEGGDIIILTQVLLRTDTIPMRSGVH